MVLALCNYCLLCGTRILLTTTWVILPRAAIKLLHWLEPENTWLTSVSTKSLASLCACTSVCVPLFLLNRLLPQRHILHVFLESVEWGIWFYTNTIVMIFGVPSAGQKQKWTHINKVPGWGQHKRYIFIGDRYKKTKQQQQKKQKKKT